MTRSFLLNAAGVALAVLTFPIWGNALLMAFALFWAAMPLWCLWSKRRKPSAEELQRQADKDAAYRVFRRHHALRSHSVMGRSRLDDFVDPVAREALAKHARAQLGQGEP